MHERGNRSGFTLIELLVVIAIIAILAVVVVLTLNPAELLRQSRDANRLSDMNTLTNAINLYSADQGGAVGYSLGTSTVAYISTPDPGATTTAGTNCTGLGLSANGNFHCAATSTYRSVNGQGWIPINFNTLSAGSPFGSLPIDLVNATSSAEYYEYMTNGTTFELGSVPESQKYSSLAISGGFTAGSTNTLFIPGFITFTTSTVATTVGFYEALAFDSHANTIWMTIYGGSVATQINDTTYAASSSALPGSYPLGIAFDSHTNTIWVANNGGTSGNTVTQINDTTPYATMTYAVGTSSADIAFDSHTNTIWMANGGTNNVTQINETTYATSTYAVAGIGGIAFDSHTNTIWVAGGWNNNVTQINDTTPYATTTYAVGTDAVAVAFDSHTNSIWVANAGGNTVTKIDDTSYAKTTYAISSVSSAYTIAFDSHTNSIWVLNSGTNTVTQINDTTYATSTYTVGTTPNAIVFDSHTNTIWVANQGSNNFTVFTPTR